MTISSYCAAMADVRATYFTDPACSWSWSIEPILRRLEVEFGNQVQVSYVMAGIREFAAPEREARLWLDAAAKSGMPVDARLWLEGGPTSSYPAGMAVKAAREQGLDAPYLRRLREGFAFRRRRLDHADAFMGEAQGLAGLDLERFRIDLGSHAILEAFGTDLERGRAVDPEQHGDGGRVRLPSIEFAAADGGETHAVYGAQPYEAYRHAAVAAGAQPVGEPAPSVETALARFGTLATAEVIAVTGLPEVRAQAELWRLAEAWAARPEPAGPAGRLWSPA
jgi:predicted DsbA family dithiol-disulfide isomerase